MTTVDAKKLMKAGIAVLSVILAFIVPIGAIAAFFSGWIEIDTDRINEIVSENISAEEHAGTELRETIFAELESRMAAPGYSELQILKAKLLCGTALYPFLKSEEFTKRLIDCFSVEQTDDDLIAAVNAEFGTSIEVSEFISVFESFMTQEHTTEQKKREICRNEIYN